MSEDIEETPVAPEQPIGGDTTTEANASQASESGAEASPAQGEMPFAIVAGKALTEVPKDLYIPPDALEIILEVFEGPLDLLLYLIRKQNIDILDINVADITRQYINYVEMMNALQFELAAEYLVMAAMLAEIKSRMLLPRAPSEDEEEEEAEEEADADSESETAAKEEL